MKTILKGWMNFWAFCAQFFQDSTGKSSSTRLTGYIALLTLVFEINRAHLLPIDSGTLYTLSGIICGAFGFKIWGEKNQSSQTVTMKLDTSDVTNKVADVVANAAKTEGTT